MSFSSPFILNSTSTLPNCSQVLLIFSQHTISIIVVIQVRFAATVDQPYKMASMKKINNTSSQDPEKVAELTNVTTYGQGETRDTLFIHADPNDGDEALKAFVGHEGDVIIMTPEVEKKLLRKIDLNLMPVCVLFKCLIMTDDLPSQILCVCYGLNYLDKTTLSYASIMGLQTDIHLKGTNYQWLGSMFYIGYLAWE